MDQKNRKIVFIENKDVLKIHFSSADFRSTHIISMNPNITAILKRRNIPYTNTLEYFGSLGHTRVSNASTEMIKVLEICFSNLLHNDLGYAYGRTASYYLALFFNYVLSRIFIITRVLDDLNPESVLVYRSDVRFGLHAKIMFDDNLLGFIIQRVMESRRTEVSYVYFRKNTFKFGKTIIGHLLDVLTRTVFEFTFFIFRIKFRNKRFLMSPVDTYNMPRLLGELRKSIVGATPIYMTITRSSCIQRFKEMLLGDSFSFIRFPNRSSQKDRIRFERHWKLCSFQMDSIIGKTHVKSFMFMDIDISFFLFEYWSKGLANEMYSLNAKIFAMMRVLDIREPNAVFSQSALGVSYALGEICRKRNIPAILISHGSHVPHTNEIAINEWKAVSKTSLNSHYPYVAVQTDMARQYIMTVTDLLSKPIKTGPLLFAKKFQTNESYSDVRKRLYGDRKIQKIVVHAATPKSWNSLRPWIFETVDEYIDNINTAIEAAKRVEGLYLAIRFRPVDGISTKDLEELLIKSDCYGIYSDGTFGEYLLSSDMLLSYSSTAIEEALLNGIPVLQFSPGGKYWHLRTQDTDEDKKEQVLPVNLAKSREEMSDVFSRLVEDEKGSSRTMNMDLSIFEIDRNNSWLDSIGAK